MRNILVHLLHGVVPVGPESPFAFHPSDGFLNEPALTAFSHKGKGPVSRGPAPLSVVTCDRDRDGDRDGVYDGTESGPLPLPLMHP